MENKCSPDIIKLLEASGADSSIYNVNGELPAHYAVMKKSFGGDLEEKQRVAMLKELTHLDGPCPFLAAQCTAEIPELSSCSIDSLEKNGAAFSKKSSLAMPLQAFLMMKETS